jgi:hypothetical protein
MSAVYCLALSEVRNGVALSSDNMNHFCISLLVSYYGVIYSFARSAAEMMSRRMVFLCLKHVVVFPAL